MLLPCFRLWRGCGANSAKRDAGTAVGPTKIFRAEFLGGNSRGRGVRTRRRRDFTPRPSIGGAVQKRGAGVGPDAAMAARVAVPGSRDAGRHEPCAGGCGERRRGLVPVRRKRDAPGAQNPIASRRTKARIPACITGVSGIRTAARADPRHPRRRSHRTSACGLPGRAAAPSACDAGPAGCSL